MCRRTPSVEPGGFFDFDPASYAFPFPFGAALDPRGAMATRRRGREQEMRRGDAGGNEFGGDWSGDYGACFVSMTVGPARRFGTLSFVRHAQAAPSAEGVGWVCRTSYWASPDETALLAPRLGAIFRPARPIELLAALLAPRLEMLLSGLGLSFF